MKHEVFWCIDIVLVVIEEILKFDDLLVQHTFGQLFAQLERQFFIELVIFEVKARATTDGFKDVCLGGYNDILRKCAVLNFSLYLVEELFHFLTLLHSSYNRRQYRLVLAYLRSDARKCVVPEGDKHNETDHFK